MATKDPTPVVKNPIPVKDVLPDTPPATKTEVVLAHVDNHRPFYIWLPIACLAVYLAMEAYKSLAGRSAVDDVPIGALWNILGIVVTVILVNVTKPRLYDDIDTTDRTIPWWHICLDYFATCFLLLLFWYAISH